MIKNGCIILPDPQKSVEICDFIAQTAKLLAQDNRVFIIKEANPIALSELVCRLFKHQQSELPGNMCGYKVIRPIFILPFTRFTSITNTNYVLYYLIFQIYLLLSYFISSNKIVFWFFFPHTYRYTFRQFWVHYDCVDIHPENSIIPKIGGKTYQLLLRTNSISCIAMSQHRLLETLTNKTIHLVPQGFALPDFEPEIKTKYFRKKTKPIIGFVGALSDRIDYELLLDLVSNNPQWRFEFWGPVQTFFTDFERVANITKELKRCKNVFMMGNIPRANLYKKMKDFDIGIIPYETKSVLNQYCYPMKLIEYFYCGIPVVATPIPELKRFPKLVTTASDTSEWKDAITSLLSRPWSTINQKEQLSFCHENTWQLKINAILSVLEKNVV